MGLVCLVVSARAVYRQQRRHLDGGQGFQHGGAHGSRRQGGVGVRQEDRIGIGSGPTLRACGYTPAPQDGRFREPTDVAFDSAGNIYVTDGYINSRVAKYDYNGDWVKSRGEPGTNPGQFRLPHSIAIDKDDNVYVGDRSNARIQVFDTDGNYLREFRVAIPVRPGSTAVNGSTPTDLTEISANGAPNSLCIPPGSDVIFVGEPTFPGRIIKATLQGEVLGVIGNSGRNLGEFSGAHGLACPSEEVLYVAETSNSRAQKLILE